MRLTTNKFIIRFVYILLLFFYQTANIYAQQLVHTSLEVASGLPSPTVYDISQDEHGFMWIANGKGLCRFDGLRFLQMEGKLLQGKSLSNINWVNKQLVCQDFSGNFYSIIKNELLKIDGINNYGSYVSSFTWKNGLIFTNNNSLKYFDLNQKKIRVLHEGKSLRSAFTIEKDSFYFLSKNEIWKLNPDSKTSVVKKFQINKDIYFLLKIKNRFYGLTRSVYPYLYELDSTSKSIDILNDGVIIQNVQLINNEIWISTTTGAFCFDLNFKALYTGRKFFGEYSISKVMIDKDGHHWFATTDGGIKIVHQMNNMVWKPEYGSISCISKTEFVNEILVGTTTNSVYRYSINNNYARLIYKGKSKSELVNIYYDPVKKIIIGSGGEITKISEKGNPELIIKLAGKQIVKINQNAYILVQASGIELRNLLGKDLNIPEFLRSYPIQEKSKIALIQGERGRAIAYDSSSEVIYTSSASGTYQFNKSGRKTLLYKNKPVYASSFCWLNNILYIGTFHQGVLCLKNGKLEALQLKKGSLPESVQTIQTDGEKIWLIYNQKLYSFHPKTQLTDVFDAADGLPKGEWKDLLCIDNKLILAGSEGLIAFEPKAEKSKESSGLVLDQFQVNNKIIPFANNLQLKPNENNLFFDFSLINFTNNNDWLLQFRMNEGPWKKLKSGIRSLQLISLNDGDYHLEVAIANPINSEIIQLMKLDFKIQTIWYKTWIFFVAGGVFLILGISAYYRNNIKVSTKQNKLIQEKIQLEKELQQSLLSSIKSQMNPHFLFNALNTIQSYIYSNEKENASNYLGKFSDLTRLILEMSSKENICLSEEIKALHLYLELESLRFERNFKYQIEVNENVQTDRVFLPGMLIQPYVENAIKHGLMHKKGDWILHIKFTSNATLLRVEIEDNGIGRKASGELNQKRKTAHLGFSSDANEKRINILNKMAGNKIKLDIIDKTDAFGNPTGTLVIFEIPFKA